MKPARIIRFAGWGAAALAGLVLLVAAATAARLAVGPVSLAPLTEDVREAISEKLYYA